MMASLQLFVLLHCIHLAISRLNQYEMVNDSFWRSTSDFIPIPSTQYGTIQLLQQLRMEFNLAFYSRNDYSNWQNIFRIGYRSVNNSCHGYGSRYPSLWLTPEHNHLNLGISQRGNCHYGAWKNYPIQSNQTYFITIEFNDTWVQMTVNNESCINEQRQSQTLHNIYNQHLGVWISTDKTKPATEDLNLTLSAITIQTWDTDTIRPTTTTPSHAPTSHPTNVPTIPPSQVYINTTTQRPTQTPTHVPIMDPTKAPTISPVQYPTKSAHEPTSHPLLSTPTFIVSDATTTNAPNSTLNPEIEIERRLYTNLAEFTEQNVLFLMAGVLLSTLVCLCVVGVILFWFCCHQIRRHQSAKYHSPRKQSSLSKPKRLHYESDSGVSMSHTHRRNTSLDVAFGTEYEDRNSGSAEEGVLEKTMLDGEGYGMLNEDVVAAANQTGSMHGVEDQFAGMLNNANAVNDLMLNDVISEMATARNEEISSDEYRTDGEEDRKLTIVS